MNHAGELHCRGGAMQKPECFEYGVGPSRFDCTGLLIKAALEATDAHIDDWNRRRRHIRELQPLQIWRNAKISAVPIGAVLLSGMRTDPAAGHISVFLGDNERIHANSISMRVSIDTIYSPNVTYMPAEDFIDLGLSRQ